MSNVIKFMSNSNPDHVIEQAKGVYDDVLIIGWDKDGELNVRSNDSVTYERANFLIDKFKLQLLNFEYSE